MLRNNLGYITLRKVTGVAYSGCDISGEGLKFILFRDITPE